MLHAEARRRARRNADGDYVPLAAQDVASWDAAMIDEAEALLLRASALRRIGRYQLEAALQSAHAERRRSGRTDWTPEVQIYDALLALSGSPVVALNRALAVAELHGPRAALQIVDALAVDGRLVDYQPYWAARAGIAGQDPGLRWGSRCLRHRDRPGERSRRPALPAGMPGGIATLGSGSE
jgi:RNA polymerase sigma-70 factor (ECF subfamily)